MTARLIASLVALAAGVAAVVIVFAAPPRHAGTSMTRKAIRTMRRDVGADLEHDLVAVVQDRRARVAAREERRSRTHARHRGT